MSKDRNIEKLIGFGGHRDPAIYAENVPAKPAIPMGRVLFLHRLSLLRDRRFYLSSILLI